jgi:hypothetical protein
MRRRFDVVLALVVGVVVGFACASVSRLGPVAAQSGGFEFEVSGNTLSLDAKAPDRLFLAVGDGPSRVARVLRPGKHRFSVGGALMIAEIVPRGVWTLERGRLTGNECGPPTQLGRLCVDPGQGLMQGFAGLLESELPPAEICANGNDDDRDGQTDEEPCVAMPQP